MLFPPPGSVSPAETHLDEEVDVEEDETPVPPAPAPKPKASPVRSPSAGMSPADMEANLSQYRMFQEKKKRVGLTSPLPLSGIPLVRRQRERGPLPPIHILPLLINIGIPPPFLV